MSTRSYRRARSGFTLVELLVVIAIIGILASIVLASLNSARRKSRDARRIADIKQIQLALELYFDANNGSYPAGTVLTALAPTYIPVLPSDPVGGTAYNYQALNASGAACGTAPCVSYHLGATLAEVTNPALDNDNDNTVGFHGLSNVAEGTACNGTGGGANGTTETCFDVIP